MTKKRAGIMGWPVEHSLSPRLHGYWLKHYGIEGEYVHLPVPPDGLEKALKELPAKGFRGVNLTIPHKEMAMRYLDIIEPAAQRIERTLNDGRRFTIIDHPRTPGRLVELFAGAGLHIDVETFGDRFCLGHGLRA